MLATGPSWSGFNLKPSNIPNKGIFASTMNETNKKLKKQTAVAENMIFNISQITSDQSVLQVSTNIQTIPINTTHLLISLQPTLPHVSINALLISLPPTYSRGNLVIKFRYARRITLKCVLLYSPLIPCPH